MVCRYVGAVNLHAPAADAPAIPRKSGGAFGIPEYMPPIRRQDYQSKPSCAGGRRSSHPMKVVAAYLASLNTCRLSGGRLSE